MTGQRNTRDRCDSSGSCRCRRACPAAARSALVPDYTTSRPIDEIAVARRDQPAFDREPEGPRGIAALAP
jgi:hypothetical protein